MKQYIVKLILNLFGFDLICSLQLKFTVDLTFDPNTILTFTFPIPRLGFVYRRRVTRFATQASVLFTWNRVTRHSYVQYTAVT